MLEKFDLKKIDTQSTYAGWDNRLPDIGEVLGPLQIGVPPEGGVIHLWKGRRVEPTKYILTSPLGVETEIDIPKEAAQFSFAFDLNGRLCYGYWDTITDEVVWTFFHDLEAQMVTRRFTGTHPASALDSIFPRNTPPVDVVLAYIRDKKLLVRYQRERYTEEHEVASITSDAKLRTIGISRDNRFIFRFFSNVGEVTSNMQ